MQTVNQTIQKVYGKRPEKILQFGEGNFLRAFADWMVDLANEEGVFEGSIVLCQPISFPPMCEKINKQDGVYTLVMRGVEDGKAQERTRVLTSVSRCIDPVNDYQALMDLAKSEDLKVVISNTTEAGIAYKEGVKLTDTPPASFPGKVAAFLYARYKAFNGASDKGLLFLPVELIDFNGDKLKEFVLKYAQEWNLEPAFLEWVKTANHFTNTLVDRIVTGYPKDQIAEFEQKLGYKDDILVTSELFNLWVIEGKKEWADILPIHKTKAHVLWTEDVKPYKMRKVRILNGGHTSTVLAAYLAGHNIVLDFMNDPVFKTYLHTLLYKEVIPTLPLPVEELEQFAHAVEERFSNPYIKHKLLDISLNSCSKFTARCLPSLLEYVKKNGELPKLLTFSLAAFIKFYQVQEENGAYFGVRNGEKYPVKDDAEVLAFFASTWKTGTPAQVAHAVLSNAKLWNGQDLTKVAGLEQAVAHWLEVLAKEPMKNVVAELVK
ncbi:MAG: tagaturonate reductase [Elusimicrobiaceae bacterium]|nr:tagaturonate reductase [Elusimicrobiaceae bacterium]